MTLSDLLNADVAVAGQWLRQGWTWWTENLASLVPAALRGGGPDAQGATLDADGRGYWLAREGGDLHVDPQATGPAKAPRRVVLRLGPETGLSREVDLPLLSQQDTRRLVAMELDRLMPFPAGEAAHGFTVSSRDPVRRRQTLRLAAAPRGRALDALSRARALGLQPVAVTVGSSGPDLLQDLRGGESARDGFYWGVAVAALIGVNVFLLVYRDFNETAALRDLVEAQRPAAAASQRLKQAALEEDSGRRDLLARRQGQSPLGLLAKVNTAVPRGAWVHRLAWNGHVVRLSGLRDPAVDVLGALRRSAGFANARNADDAVQAITPNQGEAGKPGQGRTPYDIAAEAVTAEAMAAGAPR